MDPDLFDALTAPDWDLALWLAMARTLGGPVLELGCGTGRVAQRLQQYGHAVFGVEHDPALARRAGRRIGHRRVWVGDVRGFKAAEPFPLVLIPCNMLSLFQDPLELLRVASENPAPGGHLAFDLVVPEGRSWGEPPHRWVQEADGVRRGGDFDPETRTHRGWASSEGRHWAQTTFYPPLPSWPALLDQAGLRQVRQVDEGGRPPSPASRIAVVVARKAA